MTRLARIAFVAIACLVAIGAAQAGGNAVLDSNGNVYRVQVQKWNAGSNIVGTAIELVTQDADGVVSTEIIPGTGDTSADVDPVVDLDPITGFPVVAWSRDDGNGYRIMLARRDDAGWSPARVLYGDDGSDQRTPSVRVRRNLIHVVWSRITGAAPERLRLSVDRTSLDVRYGPEWLPVSSDSVVPPEGGSDPLGDVASPDLTYFSSVVAGQAPGSGSTVIVWGIRDEPLPITYYQVFALPSGVSNVRETGVGWRAQTFLTWFVSGSTLQYSLRDGSEWSDFQNVTLHEDVGVGDALIMIERMLRRARESALPD